MQKPRLEAGLCDYFFDASSISDISFESRKIYSSIVLRLSGEQKINVFPKEVVQGNASETETLPLPSSETFGKPSPCIEAKIAASNTHSGAS